ncbi:MAG TPA: fumarylacetoacetate hydrolase family protein [Acidobacteriota bacterium]|nr:fumarylacetoacetate hydrolase family protein [Acidobacteriota bacterium]HRV09499.1 fumarylacetoacetate hydrolase family protein [Acidobacteriota bacterium]
MRYCTFSHDGNVTFGFVKPGDLVVDIPAALAGAGRSISSSTSSQLSGVRSLADWLASDAAVRREVERLLEGLDADAPAIHLLREVRLLAPIPRPGKIVAVGLNYRDHAQEQGASLPERPILFAKFPTAVVGPYEPIKLPPRSSQVDPEAELCAVITRRVRRIRAEEARKVVAFTAGNDVSARDFQFGDRQWVRGKSCDTFAPLGPLLVTADELGDPHNLRIELRVNDEVRQHGTTSEMIFDTYQLVEFISENITLEPGDVIYTGTPGGVGVFRDPPVFLAPGDLVEVEIEKIGVLKNPVCSDPAD